VLAGDGPLRSRLERQARRAGLESRVRFIGAIRPESLPEWFAAADLVVLPSRSEGVPNVLLEAKACGRPFVASDVGAVRDVSDRPELELVPPEDPLALAGRIEARLAQPLDEAGGQVPDAAESGAWLYQELAALRDRRGD
ncbi:MAG TPA: glycosyltransferase, partial [Gemmatimonadales bacterium]|nr:glycosyltransferase [Gemmatimonadales bacterium]